MTIQTASPAQTVRPIPEGYHTVTPAIIVRGAAEAIDFYKQAFGAVELARMVAPDGDKVWHAEIQIGNSRVMLGDEMPEMGCLSPEALGGSPASLHIYVENADAAFDRAVAAGATVVMPVSDAFWGDRYGVLKDPFGHRWAFATHVEDLSTEEMYRRASEFSCGAGQ